MYNGDQTLKVEKKEEVKQIKLANRTKVNRSTRKRIKNPFGTELVEPIPYVKKEAKVTSGSIVSTEAAAKLAGLEKEENSEDSIRIEKLEAGLHQNRKYR